MAQFRDDFDGSALGVTWDSFQPIGNDSVGAVSGGYLTTSSGGAAGGIRYYLNSTQFESGGPFEVRSRSCAIGATPANGCVCWMFVNALKSGTVGSEVIDGFAARISGTAARIGIVSGGTFSPIAANTVTAAFRLALDTPRVYRFWAVQNGADVLLSLEVDGVMCFTDEIYGTFTMTRDLCGLAHSTVEAGAMDQNVRTDWFRAGDYPLTDASPLLFPAKSGKRIGVQ